MFDAIVMRLDTIIRLLKEIKGEATAADTPDPDDGERPVDHAASDD